MPKIEVDLDDIKAVFDLIERVHEFLHQPKHYESIEQVREFAATIYPELHDAYYNKVWRMLPEVVQQEIENR